VRFYRDPVFGAALVAAPFVWLVWYFYTEAEPRWEWPLAAPWSFLLLVLVYPVLEEIVFRGVVQGWLLNRHWGRSGRGGVTVANLVTSIIFAAAHLLRLSVLPSAAMLAPSLVFGFFRDRYGHIFASTLLHVFYNAGFVWFFTDPASSPA
jgi:membrane protease YdiL (CAAX protease family)